MEMVFLSGPTVRDTRANMKMISDMASVSAKTRTAKFIKVIGLRDKCTEKEN